ncbi:MAG TPA: class D sortase [Bryobacteraceae bacterium]|jgi:sortase A|nr:class D sortase [Bryobacteraceae bacterium]
MKVVVERKPLRRILQWTQSALFAAALLFLGYCGFALVDAWNFQARASRDLDRQLRDRRAANQSTPQPQSPIARKAAPAATADGLIGRIEIPRLLLSVVVVEGISRTTLRRAVGHIPGTALPGEAGNVGLSGHRDTFFRPLKDLRIKDEIRFSTLKGNFNYEVESLRVVEPDNVGVLAPSGENVLTMVTCYPFYYVGPAPKRWIVRARQVSPQTAPPSTVE